MSERNRVRLSQSIDEQLSKQTEATTESETQQAAPNHQTGPAQSILQLQRTHGNQAVQRMIRGRVQRSAHLDGGPINSQISEEINSKRGGGGSLDSSVQAEMSDAMGYDFSGVNVHTDSTSNQLNQDLGAKAFTTGSDIFFSEGSYSPTSSGGKELLAHELTHVVQQDGMAPSGDLTLGPAEDSYESEADSMANQVTSGASTGVQAKRADVQREEEEEALQAKRADVQRMEEDELQAKRADVQRMEEDELQAKRADVQRNDMEEESLQAKRADVQREDMPEEDLA